MFTSLMTTRRFAPLFLCQFFAAFGDNFLKTALVFVILFQVSGAEFRGADHARRRNASSRRSSSCRASAASLPTASTRRGSRSASNSSRCSSPRSPLRALRSIRWSFCSSRCFCSERSASLFGPIKYGILPDHLAREELPAGNALIEGGTFLAILLGTITGRHCRQGQQQSDPFRLVDDLHRVRQLDCRAGSSRAPARARRSLRSTATSSLPPAR